MNNQLKIFLGIFLVLGISLAIALVGHNAPTTTVKTLDAAKDVAQVENAAVANTPAPNQEVTSPQQTLTASIPESQDINVEVESVEGSVEFSDVGYLNSINGYDFYGTLVFSNTPIEQLEIKIFCENVETANGLSELNGNFSIVSHCAAGQDSYAEVTFNDKTVRSKQLIVPHGGFVRSPVQVTSNPAGVPEYSTLTIGLAVITVLFGLILIRRK